MIKIKKFDKIVEQAQKRISNQEIQSTKKAIDMIFKTIKSVIYSEREKLTENSKDDISQISYKAELAMQKILRERLMKVSEDVPIENEAHILNAYQELLYNHAKRKEIYNKIKGVETSQLEKGDLGNNIEKNEEFIMKQILYMYRSLGNTTFIREYEGLKVAIQRKNPKQELIEEAFLSSRDIFSENIRKRYITGLKTIGEIIKYFGFFGEYEKRENSRLEKIGIEQEKTELKQYFNEEYLGTLPIKTLIAMSAFWENRLTKEIEKITNATFILQDLNLIEKILNDEGEYQEFPFEKLLDKKIELELLKTEFLKEVTQMCVDEMEEDLKKQKRQEEKVKEVDITPYIREVAAEYQEEYNEYFSKLVPNTMNILTYDIEDRYMTGKNMVNNLYKGKNASVLALIELCLTRDTIQNWGYIEEDNNLGNFIILGFDIEGLNMPLRIHIPKDYLKEFLEANEMQNIVPIYKGNEDFMKLGESMKTPALIPMSLNVKRQIKDMEINRKGSVQQAMYLEHLKYLANTTTENFPQRLKTPKVIGKGKKQKVKYLIKREYIDLDTKQKYEMDKEENYVPIPEKEAR